MVRFKVCSACKADKPVTDFYIRNKSVDGLQHVCKVCSKLASIKWEEDNPEVKKEINAIWYLKNKDRKHLQYLERRKRMLKS